MPLLKNNKQKKNILMIALAVLFISGFLTVLNLGKIMHPSAVLAADASGNSKIYEDVIKDKLNTAGQTGLPGSEGYELTLLDRIAIFINRALTVLGILFLIIIIVAGFKWMTSGGNQEEVAKAKKMLTAGLIGIAIIFLAYGISAFVFNVMFSDYWRK